MCIGGSGLGARSDIWIGEVDTGRLTRITFDEHSGCPVWTSDGERVAFGSRNEHGAFLDWKAADGSDATAVLIQFDDPFPRGALDWTPDGKWLLFHGQSGTGRSNDVDAYCVETREVVSIARIALTDWNGSLSPDGRFVVYNSEESGTTELYVRPFPRGESRWQISHVGSECVWSPAGDEILYNSNGVIVSVPVKTQPGFSHGRPREVVPVLFRSASDLLTNFDVARDGRILIARSTSEDTREHYLVVAFGALGGGQ